MMNKLYCFHLQLINLKMKLVYFFAFLSLLSFNSFSQTQEDAGSSAVLIHAGGGSGSGFYIYD